MKLVRLIIPALVAVALVGCGGEPAPAARAPVPHRKAPKPEPVKTETAVDGPKYIYAYNPVGKRDPFRSPLEELSAQNPNQASTCTEPLCQWDLDQLKLVAVVTGESNPVAMVEDPQGVGYIIHRGKRMGKLGGKVTQILRSSVIVTEFFVTPDGKSNPNPRTLEIEKEKQDVGSLDLISGRYIQ
jgi:type IV pilus assembly protein PilP